jgi:hypothetical protein
MSFLVHFLGNAAKMGSIELDVSLSWRSELKGEMGYF